MLKHFAACLPFLFPALLAFSQGNDSTRVSTRPVSVVAGEVEIEDMAEEIVIAPITEKYVSVTRTGGVVSKQPTFVDCEGANTIYYQPTNPTLNAYVLRLRGLPGRHTQLVIDGFPVYGGLANGFDLPHLNQSDIGQVELLKGPASTYFGNGAIGGILDVDSRYSSKNETMFWLNANSIGGQSASIYTNRRFNDHFTFSNVASLHRQSAYDPDDDGYTDLPRGTRFNLHPTARFRFNENNTVLNVQGVLTHEQLRGGDIHLANFNPPTPGHFYLQELTTTRGTSRLKLHHRFNERLNLIVKNSFNLFDRAQKTREFSGSPDRYFNGLQTNSFSEASLFFITGKSRLRTGAHLVTESFQEGALSGGGVHRDQRYLTAGAFAVHNWTISEKLSLESGLRGDYVTAQSEVSENGGNLLLAPRLNLLFQPAQRLWFRIGGGTGYRMPSVFDGQTEPFNFRSALPIDFANVRPEQSRGGEFSITYARINAPKPFSIQQRAFFNQVRDFLVWAPLGNATANFINSELPLISRGLETDIIVNLGELDFQATYQLNDVYYQDSLSNIAFPLTPTHIVSGNVRYSPGNWTFFLSGEWRSSQLLPSNERKQSFFLLNAHVRRKLGPVSLLLAANNILDARQSRFESLLSAPYGTTQFSPVWAPLTGFFMRGGIELTL
jgi:outer membrane receptor for ferrienterochelin and colicins